MEVSVIIPCLNEAPNLRELLPFFLDAGDPRIREVLVVDAASCDDSAGVATALGARVIRSAVRSRAVQLNLGARSAVGDILYFVHADTRPPADYLDRIAEKLGQGYSCGCFAYRFDSTHPLLKVNARFTRFKGIFCGGGDQTLFITRSVFEQENGFRDDLPIMEDFEFTRRLRKRYRFAVVASEAIVSARKYAHNSYLKVNLVNLFVFILFFAGADPHGLKRRYQKWLRNQEPAIEGGRRKAEGGRSAWR